MSTRTININIPTVSPEQFARVLGALAREIATLNARLDKIDGGGNPGDEKLMQSIDAHFDELATFIVAELKR